MFMCDYDVEYGVYLIARGIKVNRFDLKKKLSLI